MPPVDLSRCETEPVHLPGAIQPHGVLFVLAPPGLEVTCVSDNCQRIIGLTPEELLGRRIDSITDVRGRAELRQFLELERFEERNPVSLMLESGTSFDAIAHRHDGRLIVEFEPRVEETDPRRSSFYNRVRGSLVRLRGQAALSMLCQQAAREVRLLTGFDRVLIYAFKPDWSGEVVAEDCVDGGSSYLGLRFPASDIPSQARALYASCRLRMIPTSTYAPAKLVGVLGERPLDLTHAVLRAISPVHLEYMRNMGVTASMGVSLLRDGQLWGLITCNHESGERLIPFEARAACALIGEVVSLLLGERQSIEAAQERAGFLDAQAKLIQWVVQDGDVVCGLTQHTPSILDVTRSAGAALYYKSELHCLGKTPPPEAIVELLAWVEKQGTRTLVMDSLPEHYAAAHSWKDVGCGLIAASISFGHSSVVSQQSWLLWFRPEVLQTVIWGGDPNKPASAGKDAALSPRTSFARWSEEAHLKAVPFSAADVAAADSLAHALIDVILESEASRQIREKTLLLSESNRSLNVLSEDLARKNADLEQHRHHLEALVEQRTADLQSAHKTALGIESALDGVGVGVLWSDAATGRLLHANQCAADILGYSLAELHCLSVQEINPNVDPARFQRFNDTVRERGRAQFESNVRTKDGRYVPVDVTLHFDAGDAVNPAHMIVFFRDTSARKAADLVLARANAFAEAVQRANEKRSLVEAEARMQSRKMEAVGTLAAGIAHDFNNILGSIVGFTEMTLDRLPYESSAKANLAQILSASLRARDLVAGMLAFARESPREPVAVDVVAQVVEVLALLRASLGRSVELSFRSGMPEAEAPARILADPTQVQQIVMNLCINAADAMGNHGVVRISVDPAGKINGAPAEHLAGIYLSVADSGSGMTPEVLERMFDPFFTTKAPGQGSGLGLSVVYGVVASLGGLIEVQSHVSGSNAGTEFRIFLPLAQSSQRIGETHGTHPAD